MFVNIHACIQGILLLPQALCGVIIEAVFPTCAMYKQCKDMEHINATALMELRLGMAHRVMHGEAIVTGSTAEGLTVTPGWGHPWPDYDCMHMHGAQLGVTIPGQQAPCSQHGPTRTSPALLTASHTCSFSCYTSNPHNSCLEYAPEDCPPACTRLRVTNLQVLLWHPGVDTDCVEEEDDHH